jgi:hypothetical protein
VPIIPFVVPNHLVHSVGGAGVDRDNCTHWRRGTVAGGHTLNNRCLAGARVVDVDVKLMTVAVWGGAAVVLVLFEGFGEL